MARKRQDRGYEKVYFDEWIKKYGSYEVYPQEEYERIISETDIRSEKNGSLLLDIGCGAGAFSLRLSKEFKVIGVDISEEAVRSAKQRRDANSGFLVADFSLLPIKSESLDIAFSAGALHHCPAMLSMVTKEIHRVLKPGGKFYIFEPHAFNFNNFYNFHFSAEPTINEKALLPFRLKSLLNYNGFSNFNYKDIGDVTHIQPEDYKGSLRLKRSKFLLLPGLIVLVLIKMISKIPGVLKIFPGQFFILTCEKS